MKRIITLTLAVLCFSLSRAQVKIYVSPTGNDNDKGTLTQPVKTLENATQKALRLSGKNVSIQLRGGIYYLTHTIDVQAGEYSLKSLTIEPYSNEQVMIAGAKVIHPKWQKYKSGILETRLALGEAPDQLFMNGKSMHMARYPNFDPSARVYDGTAADALSDERVKRWADPAGGYIHALHRAEWGDFHYQITGKDANGKLTYVGGWQNNRPAQMHKDYRFVENIFEELDSPAEWFYNKQTGKLYLYPPKGADLSKAVFTVSTLTDLLHFKGSVSKPLKNVTIRNIAFTQTARSFMLVKEPLLRSDWCIYRGGAILLDGTESVKISNCRFYQLGGNAVFLSNYNKNDKVKDNHIYDIGGNAISFVGSADAVRSPAFRYESFVSWNQMDYERGPKTTNYPQYCTASGNLIHHIGTVEKQVAAAEISMSAHITISHNTIYTVPRSGINVSEGTWGGHVIEFNDVFNTVLETGDHGAYNSWGRDRYWRPERDVIDSIVAAKPGIELLDVIDPIIIRNNRFQCDHGWDVDLDDGSSSYQIYNNICLSGGLKLREGYRRIVTNNILYNNTFHPHVWLKNSGDVFKNNIVTSSYAPILMNNWGKEIDDNFFLTQEALLKAQALNLDKHSKSGEAQFIDINTGNFHVKPASAALSTGFKNFEMAFGVTDPVLKKIAAKPVIRPLITQLDKQKGTQVDWLGAIFKNVETLGERSAAGLPDNNGALLIQQHAGSLAQKSGLQKGDVIIKLGSSDIKSIADLLKAYQSIKWMGNAEAVIIRNQGEQKITMLFK